MNAWIFSHIIAYLIKTNSRYTATNQLIITMSSSATIVLAMSSYQCTYLYLRRHSPGAGWAGITNCVDHISDGGTPGSAVLRQLTRQAGQAQIGLSSKGRDWGPRCANYPWNITNASYHKLSMELGGLDSLNFRQELILTIHHIVGRIETLVRCLRDW